MIRDANYYGIIMLVTPHDDDLFYVNQHPKVVTNINRLQHLKPTSMKPVDSNENKFKMGQKLL